MATGSQLAKGGVGQFGTAASVFPTGDCPATSTTMGTDTTPVVTQTYIARVFIPANTQVTGASLLNGSAVAGNVTAILYNASGVPIAQSASTAQAGIAGYQNIPFATAVNLRGPGLHYIGFQFDSTSARFRSHAAGVFTTLAQTGQTYGTATTFTSPNSFTANVGPVASTY